jgi:hypothetical protein
MFAPDGQSIAYFRVGHGGAVALEARTDHGRHSLNNRQPGGSALWRNM